MILELEMKMMLVKSRKKPKIRSKSRQKLINERKPIMGLAKLNIWVSGTDDPCSVSPITWYVTIFDCDGNVLNWHGRNYVVMPAPFGHLEVDVPPGCYYIKAVWGFWLVAGPVIRYRVNHFTDAAIVQACCDQHVCVKLFNPSIHRCGEIVVRAVRDLMLQKVIQPKQLEQVKVALNEALKEVEMPKKAFELALSDEEIEKLVKAQEKKSK
jgi:hypothetical protein